MSNTHHQRLAAWIFGSRSIVFLFVTIFLPACQSPGTVQQADKSDPGVGQVNWRNDEKL